jgi:hypothetical protein
VNRYEVIPSAGRWQLCMVEPNNMRTRLWPRYDSESEANEQMRARIRRDRELTSLPRKSIA